MFKVYHLLPLKAAARVTLNPEPEMPVAADEQVTPLPRDIWEKVRPVTVGAMVAVGAAGQVMEPMPVYDTAVCPLPIPGSSMKRAMAAVARMTLKCNLCNMVMIFNCLS